MAKLKWMNDALDLTEEAKAARIAALVADGAMPLPMAEQIAAWVGDSRIDTSRKLKCCQMMGALFAAVVNGGDFSEDAIHPLCPILEGYLRETFYKQDGALLSNELDYVVHYSIFALQCCENWCGGSSMWDSPEGVRVWRRHLRMYGRYIQAVSQTLASEGADILHIVLWQAVRDTPYLFRQMEEVRYAHMVVLEMLARHSVKYYHRALERLRAMAITEESAWLRDAMGPVIEDVVKAGLHWKTSPPARMRIRQVRPPRARTLADWRWELNEHPNGRRIHSFTAPDLEAEARAVALRLIAEEDAVMRREKQEAVDREGRPDEAVQHWPVDFLNQEFVAAALRVDEQDALRAAELRALAANRRMVAARMAQQQLMNQMRRDQRNGRSNQRANLRLRGR